MKKILYLFLILFLTGCTIKYELNIKDDYIEENIDLKLEKKGIIDNSEIEISLDSDDYINSIIYGDISAIYDKTYENKYYYDKHIEQNGNIYNVNLNYKYEDQNFNKSYILNTCFERHNINIVDGKVYIHLNGEFYCYDNEPIEITIKSDKRIKKANGKKSGNSYSWTIDQSNYNNVDIEIETTDESVVRHNIYVAIAIVFGIGLILFIIYIVGNIIGRNNVNSI